MPERMSDSSSVEEKSDSEEEMDDACEYSIETGNGYESLRGASQENEWSDEHRSKRKRNNTGSIDENSFMRMTNDDRMLVLFQKLVNIEQQQTEMKHIKQSIKDNETAVNTVRLTTVEHSSMIKLLNYRSLDLEARSRRKKLLFKGLCENPTEDCIALIKDFIYNELDLDADTMCIDRAHRIGKRAVRGISRRPIIVAFRDFQDTECIMNNASKLRGSRFGIDRDYPTEISSARKLLWNRLKDVLEYPARLVIGRKVVEDAFPDWYTVLSSKRVEPTISEAVKASNDRAEQRRQNRTGPNSYEQSSERANTMTSGWPNTQRPNTHPNPQSNLNDNMASATNSTVYNRMGEQRRADDVEDATFYSEYVNSRMRPPQQHVAWGAGTSGASGATRSLQPRKYQHSNSQVSDISKSVVKDKKLTVHISYAGAI